MLNAILLAGWSTEMMFAVHRRGTQPHPVMTAWKRASDAGEIRKLGWRWRVIVREAPESRFARDTAR